MITHITARQVGGASLLAGVILVPILAQGTTRYVDLNSTNPVVPYTSWGTASTNIQNAVQFAQDGDLILVNDGVYQEGTVNYSGATRVSLSRPLALRSVNGPEATAIVGSTNASSRVRCVYLGSGASLSGFTLTNGSAQPGAGGVEGASVSGVVSNCIIIRNAGTAVKYTSLYDCVVRENGSRTEGFWGTVDASRLSGCLIISNTSSYRGGGAGSGSYLTNCVIMDNYAGSFGGGLDSCTALNCTIVGNTAYEAGGGAKDSRLTNCIVYYNSIETGSATYANVHGSISIRNTCTTPIPSGGVDCFTTPPLFANQTAGDLHLRPNSPCLNTGFSGVSLPAVDADGRPRVVGAALDVGAFEYQGSEMADYLAWLAAAGLPTHVASDTADTDHDGANSWHEWRADTIPTNALSVFKLISITNGMPGLNVAWASSASRSYRLERGDGVALTFQTIETNIAGVAGVRTFNDVTATNSGPYFYRVGVE